PVTEGASGTVDSIFTVRLSAPSDQVVTVDYFTQNGTAQGNFVDFVSTSGTLVFAPGQIVQTITVQVVGDAVEEPDETFVVNLINASSNARIAAPVGTGTILND